MINKDIIFTNRQVELELITFTFPQTAHEAYVMMVPVITLLLGLAFFIIPGRMLALLGVEAQSDKPAAKGVGRYLFASFMLALGLCCLLVQEPAALQPGLNAALGYAWIFTSLGIVSYIYPHGKRDALTITSSSVAAIIAFILGMMALISGASVGLGRLNFIQSALIMNGIGVITLSFGLSLFCLPKRILTFLGLQDREAGSGALVRSGKLPAGFFAAVGFGVLFFNDPPIASLFVQIVMGLGWIFVGIGLIVSMLFDAKFPNGFSKLRVVMTIISLGMGSYCLLKIFGYL